MFHYRGIKFHIKTNGLPPSTFNQGGVPLERVPVECLVGQLFPSPSISLLCLRLCTNIWCFGVFCFETTFAISILKSCVFVFVFDIVFVYLVQPLFPGPPSPLNRGPTRPGNRWSLLSISDCLPPPFNWHHTLSAKFCICIFILSLLSISEYCLSSTFNWHLTIQTQFLSLL